MQQNIIIDKNFGPYTLEKVLGETDFSQTYLARKGDDEDSSLLVLRRFRRNLSQDEKFIRYIRFVMQVLGLLDHPSVLNILDKDTENEQFFITRPFIEGFSLEEMIDHSLRGDISLTAERALAILVQVIDVLNYASGITVSEKRKGVTHSNLAPSNIFITREGQVILTDFRPPFTRPDLLKQFKILPLDRVSPEMIALKPVKTEADIFLVGFLIYELIYQDKFGGPFEDVNGMLTELKRRLPLKQQPPPEAPNDINGIIERLLDYQPKTRIKNYQALQDYLSENWGTCSLEESREILKSYCAELSSDQVHDIMEDFKEEIEDTLGLMDFEEEVAEELVTESEPDPLSDVLSDDEKEESPQKEDLSSIILVELDQEAIGIKEYMTLLQNVKQTLQLKPNNEELIKSGYDILQKINDKYHVFRCFQRAEMARERGSMIDSAIMYLMILGIEKENDKALRLLKDCIKDSLHATDEATQEQEENLEKGIHLFSKKKYHEAIEILGKIPKRTVHFRQAKDLISKASAIIDQQVDNEFAYQEGLNHLENGEYELAIQEFTKVLAMEPNHLASIEGIQKAQEELLTQHQTIEKIHEEAVALVQNGDLHGAIARWQEILKVDTENQMAKDYILETEGAISKRDQKVNEHLAKADTFLEVERLDKALIEWQKVIELDPSREDIAEKISDAEAQQQAASDIPDPVPPPPVEEPAEELVEPEMEEEAVAAADDALSSEEDPLPLEEDPLPLEEESVSVEEEPAGMIEPETSEVNELSLEADIDTAVEEPSMDDSLEDDTGDESLDPVEESDDQEVVNVREYLDQGLQSYGSGDYEEAIQVWRKVLAVEPDHEQAKEYIELAREELAAQGVTFEDEPSGVQAGEEVIDELPLEDDLPELVGDGMANIPDDQIVVETGDEPVLGDDIDEASTDRVDLQELTDDDLPELELDDPAIPDVSSDDFDSLGVMSEDEEVIDELADGEAGSPDSQDGPSSEQEGVEELEELEEIVDGDEALEQVSPEEAVPSPPVPAKSDKIDAELEKEISELSDVEGDVEALFEKGLGFYEEGHYDKAIAVWNDALKVKPDHRKSKILIDKAKEKLNEKLEIMEEQHAGDVRKKRVKSIYVAIAGIILLVVVVGSYLGYSSWRTSKNKTMALQHYADKQFSSAIPFLENYVSVKEEDSAALEKLGVCYLNVDKPQEAVSVFQKVISLGENSDRIHVLLGQAYFKFGEYPKAREEYSKAKDKNPQNIEAVLGLAKSFNKLGKRDEALAEFNSARQIDPAKIPDPEWIVMGDALFSNGLFEESIEIFKKVRQASFESNMGIGKCYFELADYSEAVSWFSKAKLQDDKSVENKSVENRLLLGKSFYRLKEYQSAVDEYIGIIELFPDDLEVYLELGTAYLRLDKHDDAIAYYQKALKYHPDNAKLHYSLGFAYHESGNPEKALEEYQLAIAARSDYAEAYTNLGIVHYKNKDLDAAKKAWLKSLQINPDQAVIQSLLRRLGER